MTINGEMLKKSVTVTKTEKSKVSKVIHNVVPTISFSCMAVMAVRHVHLCKYTKTF